ncbi:cobalamin B12-binding domain-containing protein [Aquipuribacter sp. MA13-6]|uniref:cobalamin B12-binding domain-containing protein n=1 Tax=Aquipuribacter sp. MA13-6 TaxID=3440839 RepID=UPI003EF05DA6
MAARRDRSRQSSYLLRPGRAYPPTPPAADPDAVAHQLQATRALLRARTRSEVVDILATFVHDLGGAVLPARLGGPGILPVDISLGLSEPMLVRIDDISISAMRLENLLVVLLADARHAVARLRPDAAPEPRARPTADPLSQYFATVRAADADAACALVTDLLGQGHDVESVIREVLAPTQVEVGRLWQRGYWSVADEHAATAVTDRALSVLTSTIERRGCAALATDRTRAPRERHVLMACAEGEWHSLPARLAGAVASSRGVRVTVLGGSVPAEHLGRRLAAGDIDLLALSCTLTTNLLGALRCVEAAHAAGVPVVAGGHAFGGTPDRALAIGADGWSDDPASLANAAPDLRGRPAPVPREVLLLDAADAGLVVQAVALLDAAAPQPGTGDDAGSSRTGTLTNLLRHTAAAVLTDDVGVLSAILQWHGERDTRVLPRHLIESVVLTLAEAISEIAPAGAAALGAAASDMPTP